MKILPIQQQNNNQNIQFKGAFEAGSAVLRFLDTNQAWGANAVDLCSMVIPRTTVDFINRGPEAGTETARRESMGTLNHSMVGVYGTLGGLALASMFNKNYNVRADKIFANDDTIDILAKYWDSARNGADTKEAHIKAYTDNIAKNIKFFNTTDNEVNGFKTLGEDAQKAFSDALSNKLLNSDKKVIEKDFQQYLHTLLVSETGAETKVTLQGFGKQADNSLKTLIGNVYNVSKTFVEENVEKAFKAGKDGENAFVKGLKSLNLKRSLVGLGVATAIGMSTQPINMYLTKKKTGSDGFVGVPGREKDNSKGFKVLKALTAGAFSLGALSTITTNPKNFLNKLQFQGMSPTVNQLKLVYGLTIASRLLSARDKDELRESAVKDTLGFFNLLVLGSLVTKGVARAIDKSLINVTKENSKSFFKWIANSSLKTRDEILFEALKNQGKATVKDGKAIPFKELVKLADKTTRGKLRALNIAQVAGYLYSGLILGVGIPKLNIYMTNKSEAKRKAKLANQQPETNSYNMMLNPQNLEFITKHM